MNTSHIFLCFVLFFFPLLFIDLEKVQGRATKNGLMKRLKWPALFSLEMRRPRDKMSAFRETQR